MSARQPQFVRLTTNQNRPIKRQDWEAKPVAVQTKATPMSFSDSQSATNLLVDAFQVVVPSTAANSVWMAKANVQIGVGMECRPGIPFEWSIKQERQMYELQKPYNLVNCLDEIEIPFVVWDISNIYFIASAPTNITVILFYAVFI